VPKLDLTKVKPYED
jgi:hypothetical protein